MGAKFSTDKQFIWDAEAEALAAMFAKRVAEIRPQHKALKICQQLNGQFLKKTPSDHYGATQHQRSIINSEGY